MLAILFIVWTFFRNSKESAKTKISPSDAKKRLDTEKGIILLDVRTKEEYLEKHIPKSILIPISMLGIEASKKLPNKQADIFVYCATGSRSKRAVSKLLKMGYTNVYNLGGIFRWPYETKSGK